MINADGDAVVVDFGGGYTPDFIEKELVGLDHMAAAIGAKH